MPEQSWLRLPSVDTEEFRGQAMALPKVQSPQSGIPNPETRDRRPKAR